MKFNHYLIGIRTVKLQSAPSFGCASGTFISKIFGHLYTINHGMVFTGKRRQQVSGADREREFDANETQANFLISN